MYHILQELDAKLCKKTGKTCNGHCHKNGLHSHDGCDNQMPKSIRIVGATTQWLKPASLSELRVFLSQYRSNNYRLVFGNTAFGRSLFTEPLSLSFAVKVVIYLLCSYSETVLIHCEVCLIVLPYLLLLLCDSLAFDICISVHFILHSWPDSCFWDC